MFDSTVLEVVIGLVFVYLIFSLSCTAVKEWFAQWLGLRSKTLKQGISQLLRDPAAQGLARAFHAHPLIDGLCERKKPSWWKRKWWKRNSSGDEQLEKKYPSYIPAQTFALALLDAAATTPWGSDPNSESKRLLDSLVKGAEDGITGAQKR